MSCGTIFIQALAEPERHIDRLLAHAGIEVLGGCTNPHEALQLERQECLRTIGRLDRSFFALEDSRRERKLRSSCSVFSNCANGPF